MKTCTKCKKDKSLSEFHNCASKKSGKMSACKKCRNEYNKRKAAEIGHDVLYRRAIETVGEENYKARARNYYEKNSEQAKERSRAWNAANKKKKAETRRKHYLKNRDAYLIQAQEWADENREKRREIASRHSRKFRADPENKHIVLARKLIGRMGKMTGLRAGTRTEKLLGYSFLEFRAHIERNMLEGMSWENHGEWHIDHIIPITELIGLGITCPKKINALSNLIPVWAKDNLSKGNRFALSQAPL